MKKRGKHWERGRYHLFLGFADNYGVQLTIDFYQGWGFVLQVWNLYVAVEYWAWHELERSS